MGADMSQSPRVEVLPIEQGATPDPANVNKHTQRGGGLLENSLRKRGAFRSIASAGKGAETPVVYAGNLTLQKAVEAGFTEIVNVHVTGNQIVNVVRDDIAPGSPEAAALGIEDNEIGRVSYNPDIDILAALAAGDSALLSAVRQQDDIFNGLIDGAMNTPIDYAAEWQGMPGFESKDIEGAAIICLVRFLDQKGLRDFEDLIGYKLQHKRNTYSIWYPKQDFDQLGKKAGFFADEP